MRTRCLLTTLALTLSLGLSSSALHAQEKQGNITVSNITFYDTDTRSKIDQDLFLSVLGLSKGKTYSVQYIADRVSKLEELVAYKVSEWNAKDRGELVLNMAKKKKIASIEFTNNKSAKASKLIDAIGFRVVGAYCEDLCPTIINKVRKYYADQGFYNATVDLRTTKNEEGKLNITVDIQEGDPAIISSITLEANGIMSVEQLDSTLGLKKGSRVRYSYIQDRLKRVRQYLFNESCYSASIYKNSLKISGDAKTASVEVGVTTGPRFDIVFRGNTTFSNPQTLKGVLDITETDVVSRDYYPVLVKRLEDFYMSMGFTEPNIKLIEVLGDKKWELKLVFLINEGPRKYFKNVSFNMKRISLTVLNLRSYVENKKSLLFSRGFFVKKEFEETRGVIEDYFAEQGFLRARVLSVNYSEPVKNNINVLYDIDIGSETMIRSISITGNSAFSSNEIMSKLGISEGSGLRMPKFNAKVNSLVEAYRALGYADVAIDKQDAVSYSEDYRVADIKLNIYEGDKYKIGKIFIEGLDRTKERVVTREFRFAEGEKIDLNELQDTENRLAGLGLFGSVSVLLLPNSVKGAGYKDVLVKTEEKKSGAYEFGVGYRTDEGIKVTSGVVYGNLGGWNRRVNIDGSVSRKLDDSFKFVQYEIKTGYYEPYFWNLPLDFRVTVGYSKQDLTDYGRKKFDMSFYFEKTFGYHSFILRNSFERVNVFDAPILADNTAYWKYSIRQTYRLDTRDSVFSPNKGLYFNVFGEWGRSFKSQAIANYVKVVEKAKVYIPILKTWTLVPSLDAGYIKGLRGESILLDERFALGGMDSIRGYREGIINDLTPKIGSQHFYTFSLELRKLLFWRIVGIAFHDIGNVSSEDPKINGPFSSVGGGISLKLPVGSLSLQYGYVYDITKRVPPDKVGRLHFSLGTF